MGIISKAKFSECDEKGSEQGAGFFVQFNPNEISIQEHTGEFAEKRARPPKTQSAAAQETPNAFMNTRFNKKSGVTLSAKLFFNTYNSPGDNGDVRKLIAFFDLFLNKNRQEDKSSKLNLIRFSWGSIQVFGILTSLNVTYIMFSSEGTPVRAEAGISITGDYVQYKPKNAVTKETATVSDGDNSLGFAAMLMAYGSMEALKKAARTANVANLRFI